MTIARQAPRPLRILGPILLWFFCLVPDATSQSENEQRQARDFRIWLWTHQAHRPDKDAAARLRKFGYFGIQTTSADPVAEPHGLPVYLDQVLSRSAFSLSEETWAGAQPEERSPRPTCLRNTAFLKAEHERVRKILEPYRKARPEFICLRDEPAYSLLIAPADWCTSPECTAAFLTWLVERWGPRGPWEAWGLPSAEVPPSPAASSTAHARRSFFHEPDNSRALVAWNDARLFADHTFKVTLERFVVQARTLLPGVPVGFLGMQMPSAFGGFNYEDLLPMLDIVEAYDYGASRDLVGSFAQPGTRFLQTLFPGERSAKDCIQSLYEGFFRGDTDLVVYSSKEAGLHPEGQPSSTSTLLATHFSRLASPAVSLWMASEPIRAEVAILYNHADVRLHWMEDTRHDGVTWIRRLGSHQSEAESHALDREAWAAVLRDLHIPYRFISTADLERGGLQRNQLRACILVRASALSHRAVSALEDFVRSGGLLMADSQAGLYTETLRRHSDAQLDDLFGIRRETFESHYEGESIAAKALRGTAPLPVAEPHLRPIRATAAAIVGDDPILLKRNEDDAKTLYLNLILRDYRSLRLSHPERAAWVRAQVRTALTMASVNPPATFVHGETSPRVPVRIFMRRAKEGILLAAHINPRTNGKALPRNGSLDDIVVSGEIHLDRQHSGQELFSGRVLVPTRRIPVELRLDQPVLFHLKP